jgi:hypothetical protein
VLFEHPRAFGLGAGYIVDVGAGGVRIVAPPTTPTPLRWGEPINVTISYSEATRDTHAEGYVIEAVVLEVSSTAQAFCIRCRFVEPLTKGMTAVLAGLVSEAA